MEPLLNLVEKTDYCSALMLILILASIGNAMVAKWPELRSWGLRVAAAIFLAYGVYGLWDFDVLDAHRLLLVTLRGLVAGGLALGPVLMVLAVFGFVFEMFIQPAIDTSKEMATRAEQIGEKRRRQQEEDKRRNQEETERRERERQREPVKPPPTREERAAAALGRYEAALQLLESAALDDVERAAARAYAKQQYLRELQEVMK